MARAPLAPERASPVTTAAPHIRAFWTGERIAVAEIAALLPPLGMAAVAGRFSLAEILVVALAAAAACQFAFTRRNHAPVAAQGAVTALIVAVMVPPGAPLWQIALAVGFAGIVGERIFGGYGRNFVSTAGLALTFLMFSFPDAGYDKAGIQGWAAVLPGAIGLMILGIVNWRIVLPALGLVMGIALTQGGWPAAGQLVSGSLVFGLVFIAGDPVSAPSSNGGRWAYGLGIGLFVALGAGPEGASARTVVFACLIGSIFAPLIDQAAIWVNLQHRRWRHGRI